MAHPAFLGLVSDQYLRTIVIAGRNDLGCPDFQNRVPGKPMSEEEISGVVAWLVGVAVLTGSGGAGWSLPRRVVG